MSWIKKISYEASTGRLRSLYDRVKGPGGHIDNILLAHSLRPHTLEGHMRLYKNVLHHNHNTLPKWLLEALGVYVSLLNECAYCVAHHFEGMRRALGDEARARAIREALEQHHLDDPLTPGEAVLFRYAERLTTDPASVDEALLDDLRGAGYDDGEILEANQVISYFAYANRMVLGLGLTTAGEAHIGLSPSDSTDPENWHHRGG